MTRAGLLVRVKALEKRVANRPMSPKAVVPAWLIEDLLAAGVPADPSSGLPDWRQIEEFRPATANLLQE